MRKIVMVEIEDVMGPYPAVYEPDSQGELWFNRPTIERICRDSRSPVADIPGEGEYVRLVNVGGMECLEFYRVADEPTGEQVEPVWASPVRSDGRFPIPPTAQWPWSIVTGGRGQVWECCVSTILPVCRHQAERPVVASREG